jgi:hypothetical protein
LSNINRHIPWETTRSSLNKRSTELKVFVSDYFHGTSGLNVHFRLVHLITLEVDLFVGEDQSTSREKPLLICPSTDFPLRLSQGVLLTRHSSDQRPRTKIQLRLHYPRLANTWQVILRALTSCGDKCELRTSVYQSICLIWSILSELLD